MKDDVLYLRHILEAIGRIESIAQEEPRGFTQEWAMERGLAIVGQAARNISKTFQKMNPEIHWSEIIGLRHKIVYDYFGMDWGIIEIILKEFLPGLKGQIEGVLATQEKAEKP